MSWAMNESGWEKALDRYLTTPPDEDDCDYEFVSDCVDCGEPIYECDDYYYVNGEHICENCIDNYKVRGK